MVVLIAIFLVRQIFIVEVGSRLMFDRELLEHLSRGSVEFNLVYDTSILLTAGSSLRRTLDGCSLPIISPLEELSGVFADIALTGAR